jgi:hypothetical protein
MIIEDDLKDLPKLRADVLARRLRDHFAAVGGLACAGEVEIAREAVRRARRAERAEAGSRLTRTTGLLVVRVQESVGP